MPSRVLADALASEWQDQSEKIDPGLFLFRDHADFAIDIVRADRDAAIDKLIGYAETDTLCYRADPEDALYRHQQDRWEPLVEHLENRFGMRFQRVSGIVHRPQAEETLAALRHHLETLDDFALAGVTAMASLAASLCIALLASDEAVNDPMALWRDARPTGGAGTRRRKPSANAGPTISRPRRFSRRWPQPVKRPDRPSRRSARRHRWPPD